MLNQILVEAILGAVVHLPAFSTLNKFPIDLTVSLPTEITLVFHEPVFFQCDFSVHRMNVTLRWLLGEVTVGMVEALEPRIVAHVDKTDRYVKPQKQEQDQLSALCQ